MGKSRSTLPTMGEDTTGTTFMSDGERTNANQGLPDNFDDSEHQRLLDEFGSVIENQIYEHNEDDFRGSDDDAQVNDMIREQWEQARNMLQASQTLLNKAIEYDDMAVDNSQYNELASQTYDKYTDSFRQLVAFINNIPQ